MTALDSLATTGGQDLTWLWWVLGLLIIVGAGLIVWRIIAGRKYSEDESGQAPVASEPATTTEAQTEGEALEEADEEMVSEGAIETEVVEAAAEAEESAAEADSGETDADSKPDDEQ